MKRHPIKKGLRIISRLGIAVVTTLVAVAFSLLATETGSQWVIQKALASKVDSLSWKTMQGTLMSGVHLSGLSVTQENVRIEASDVSSRWTLFSVFSGHLRIKQLHINDLTVITGSPSEKNQMETPWPVIKAPLPIKVDEIKVVNIRFRRGSTEFHIDNISVSGTLGILSTRLKKFSVNQSNQSLIITGKIGAIPPYPLSLNLDWQALLDNKTHFKGAADVSGNLAQLKLNHQLKTPIQINTSGSLTTDFRPGHAAFDVTQFMLNLSNRWSLVKQPVPTISKTVNSMGQFTLLGSIDNYTINSHFDLVNVPLDTLPKQSITIAAKGSRTKLDISALEIVSKAAHISGSGEILWANNLTWNAKLHGTQINPATILKDWPGQIESNVSIQGSMTPRGLSSTLIIQNTTGTLRDFPLSLTGQISYNEGTFSTEKLALAIDKNQLTLDASFNEKIKAQWLLSAKNLSAIYPGAKGAIHSQGTLSGTHQKPRINATLDAHAVSVENFSAASIITRVKTATDDEHHVKMDIVDAQIDTQTPVTLTLLGNGKLHHHTYTITADNKDTSLTLDGIGHWNQQRWYSELSVADLNSPLFGDWRLLEPTNVQLQSHTSKLMPTCWLNGKSKLCTEIRYSANAGLDLVCKIDQLALAHINPWLPPDTQLDGPIKGDITLTGQLDKLDGKLALAVNTAQLQLNTSGKKPKNIALRNTRIDGAINSNVLHLNAKAELLKTGIAETHIVLPLKQTDAPLNAELTFRFEELDWLSPFFPHLSDISGRTNLKLKLAGTRNKPQITGAINVNRFSVGIPELGIQLKKGTLAIKHVHKNDWRINGRIDSGDGTLQLNGTATVDHFSNWHSRLSVSGQQWQAVNLEPIKADVNPRLLIQASTDKLLIEGDIDIAQAQILLKALPLNTVTVSEDEMIVGNGKHFEKPLQKMAIISDVNLTLGEHTAFNGFGIKGGLTGQLRAQEHPEQALRIDGRVNIVKGIYKAYGQELSIDPGRLIFQGPPDNPTIDVRASRTVEETLVGVQIGGTARSVTSVLYSTPSLPPTDTLALLITGKPLSGANEADADVLMAAVTSLGITQSEGLTQYLQQTFGLDVLTLSSGETVEQSAVTIGKYLTPKLFVSYAQEILTPNATINLEYSLTDKLKIKAESGTNQSMDILYRIDH